MFEDFVGALENLVVIITSGEFFPSEYGSVEGGYNLWFYFVLR